MLTAHSSQLFMTHRTDEPLHESAKHPLVMRVTDNDFQCEVLEKLARLEAKMDMLAGGTQPGRMRLAEEKIAQLERNVTMTLHVRRGESSLFVTVKGESAPG